MKTSNQIKLKGRLKTYMQWPFYIGALLITVNIAMAFVSRRAALLLLAFTLVYCIITGILVFRMKPSILHSVVDFAVGYAQVQKQMLNELEVPYAILDGDGKILWCNLKFYDVTEGENVSNKYIFSVFPELPKEVVPENVDITNSINIKYRDRDYRVELRRVPIDGLTDTSDLLTSSEDSFLVSVYLFDETEVNEYIQHIEDEKFVAGLIYIDNYDEVLDTIEEVRQSLLMGLIDRNINKSFSGGGAVIKKLEKDKYLVVMRYKYLLQLEEDKFSVLEAVKSVNIGNEMRVTISIGIGANEDTYAKNYEKARQAMDLALGRGGDQVVIKDGDKILYFGGKSQQIEKNTRVKARVKAHALREIIENKDKVMIMGHKLGDVDSFGASVGLYRCAKALDKRAYIVINDITTSVRPFIDKFIGNSDYEKDMIINGDAALDLVDNNTAVVIVDVNKTSITECVELLDKCRTKVVLDHHRAGNDTIQGAVLSYVEPFASSSCEMVAEILQYIKEGVRLRPIEADALYAGMIIDTDNFVNKAGVRTFEAAAFLRRSGADITRVRKLLRNDMRDYKAKADAISHAQIFKECFVISSIKADAIESPTIVAAQAANELLNINGIKASFVMTSYNDKIYISARSIDEINVQLIMEKLGGGGHMNIAGAQLVNTSTEEAVKLLKMTITSMIENNEI